jgi:DNA-binding CsgD family transcriptional regulator
VRDLIPSGRRNQELTSAAGTVRWRGLEEIRAALAVMNERRCDPPLEAEEGAKIATSVARYEPVGDVVHVSFNGHGSSQPPEFNRTDLGDAGRLIHRHGHNLRNCLLWGKLLVYDDRRFRVDDTGEVYRLAADTVARIYQEAAAAPDEKRRKALAKLAMRSEAGQIAAPRQVLEHLVFNDKPVNLDALSSRQKEILELVGEGLSNARIAERLFVSVSTAKQHLRAAYKVLGVSSRTEAVRLIRSH